MCSCEGKKKGILTSRRTVDSMIGCLSQTHDRKDQTKDQDKQTGCHGERARDSGIHVLLIELNPCFRFLLSKFKKSVQAIREGYVRHALPFEAREVQRDEATRVDICLSGVCKS